MKIAFPRLPLVLIASTTGFGLPVQAAVLFSDDFEGHDADTTIAANWTQRDGAVPTVRDETTATPFGSPNQYAQVKDSSTTSSGFVRLFSSTQSGTYDAVTTLSFDFYEPNSGGNDDLIFGYAGNDGNRYDLNSAGRRAAATFNNGTIGGLSGGTTTSYSLETSYTVYMILNDTTSEVTYSGGTLAAETAHVWFEEFGSGTFSFAGSVAAANSADALGYRVGFRTFNSPVQEVWVDNVSLSEGAPVVPELRAALLGAFGLLALLRRRR